ncbi:hypothetical protein BH23CHL7_BH23CHL7_05730 [soil metagenome]
MTPREFEAAVAEQLRSDGYDAQLTSYGHDGGVDIIAKRGDECLAVQVKMYGGARPVNRRMIFELHGAAAYFECNGAVMATDGHLLPDASEAAKKLGIQVIRARAVMAPVASGSTGSSGFDEVWEKYVMPLAGKTLVRSDGSSNRLERVDWSGVMRLSSRGRRGHIPIEPFRWAIERILAGTPVSRDDINSQYEGRASSGIQLILQQVPLFECSGRPAVIRLKPPGSSGDA